VPRSTLAARTRTRISSSAIAGLVISASRSTVSGAVPYSSWATAVIVAAAAAPGVAAVIALPNDEEEIPEEPARRVDLARKLIHVATERYKIPVEDIVIDPLAMPVGADTLHPTRTLETIALISSEFGVNMTLGASNVSFGMPDRHSIAAAFLPIAISHGLTSAIMDARSPQIVRAVKAADLVLNRDEWGANWIAAHRAQQAREKAEAQSQGMP